MSLNLQQVFAALAQGNDDLASQLLGKMGSPDQILPQMMAGGTGQQSPLPPQFGSSSPMAPMGGNSPMAGIESFLSSPAQPATLPPPSMPSLPSLAGGTGIPPRMPPALPANPMFPEAGPPPPSMASKVAEAVMGGAAGNPLAGLGGQAVPEEMSEQDKFIQSLAGIEAPPGQEVPRASASSVAPQRGGQVNPNLAKFLLGMAPQPAPIPTLGALFK